MKIHLSQLRAALQTYRLDGFILPVNDEFMGEYVPASARRLEWLTGFTGSAGMAVVTQDKAAFFTDGRYTLQAAGQVPEYEQHNSSDHPAEKWLAKHAGTGSAIGYDPKLHTLRQLQHYEKAGKDIAFRPLEPNPVDALWEGRPAAPNGKVKIHPLQYAGEESAHKRTRIAADIAAQGADAAIVTAPDSLCWLLNIRANDVPFTPFALCFAIISAQNDKHLPRVLLYIDPERVTPELAKHLGADVLISHPDNFVAELGQFRGEHMLYDAANSPVWFYQKLNEAQVKIIEGTDPCQWAKACKNAVEMDGMRNAHIRDGLAVTKFLCWLDGAVKAGEALTEISVTERLETFRRASGLFLEPSFSTIAGSGPHGAIVHYHAEAATDRPLAKDAILLLDSGGQYPDGTTDITRTVATGTPSAEMKDRFTRVLKGHIALARAVFPEGTSGSQLDTLARMPLWQSGLDYDHGTGHGVGSYLSVHEGPQRISKRGGDVALLPGMVLSNEPGYYKTGEFGIRIENLVMVKEGPDNLSGNKRYFCFETLTQAPIDMRLVEDTLLTPEERAWLGEYHKNIYKRFAAELSAEELHWLVHYTAITQA